MTSKERLVSCWNGNKPDHIPLTTWCFGFKPKPEWTWGKKGKLIKHWYSLRMEHIHTLPEPWDIEDDFKRVLAWRSLGVDDVIDVSIPWSMNPEVTWKDSTLSSGVASDYPVAVREYTTPAGNLRHAVKKTGEDPGEGWVVQPDIVPLFEDYNIPRGVRHIVSKPEDVPLIGHLYKAPEEKACEWFTGRMEKVAAFSQGNGIAVQAWSSFGMDGVVWLTGVEGALMMALDYPETFRLLTDIIAVADYGRTELACRNPAVDMVVQRGWYSSTDFWSPNLFNEFVFPSIASLANLAHRYGKKFGYVMTTGVEILGKRLAEAGVDVLYFIDPVQDKFPLEKAQELCGSDMTFVGGINSVTLPTKNKTLISDSVKRAIDILGPTNRFILHPVDALFPDTPWESMELVIDTWNQYA